MSDVEKLIDLLLDAAIPRAEHPPGELDRKRPGLVARWERYVAAGKWAEADLQALIDRYDSGLDYQRDHPLNEIDQILDSAMALAWSLDADDRRAVSGLLDDTVRGRLSTYSVRCASRALAEGSSSLCDRGLLALLLSFDQDEGLKDVRDLMVSLGPLHVAAQDGDRSATVLFERHAELVPDQVGEALRAFGRRTDVTLEAFGWALSQGEGSQGEGAPGGSADWIVQDDSW